jgi:hypothetical protein
MQPTLTPAANDAMANLVAAICQGWMGLPPLFLTLSLPASPRRSQRPMARGVVQHAKERDGIRCGRSSRPPTSPTTGFRLRPIPRGAFLMLASLKLGLLTSRKAHPSSVAF